MNEITAAHKRIPDIVRAIDEIAFQTNLLTLNAAVEAAGDRSQAPWSAQAARETLALVEASINGSPAFAGMKLTGTDRERDTRTEETTRMAEPLHRIRCAAPAAGMKRPF